MNKLKKNKKNYRYLFIDSIIVILSVPLWYVHREILWDWGYNKQWVEEVGPVKIWTEIR